MFRRRWSGLPADPGFPADLKELGYFVNSDDEIRSIEDPKKYFKFFISKNQRWNERQRFAMNEAIEKLIHTRLEGLGLEKLRLPLGAGPTDPHIPIFTSADLSTFARIVVIFGEPAQDLGILAYRVASGRGGLGAGSMTSVVRAATRDGGGGPVGVVIANTGQLWWWPEGTRPLTQAGRHAVPMASAVHWGRFDDRGKNAVPQNETVGRHVRYVFEGVLHQMIGPGTVLDVIAVADAADEVEAYLDGAWEMWGGRMSSLALLGGFFKGACLACEGFKTFMRERARAYIIHDSPLNSPVAGPDGDPNSLAFTEFGCPVYSAGDATIVEMLLVTVHEAVLEWVHEVATTENYKNPHVEVALCAPPDTNANVWEDAPEYKPVGEGGLEEGGRACEPEKLAVEYHQPSVIDAEGEHKSAAEDAEAEDGGDVCGESAPTKEPATVKAEVTQEGVPPEIKAEVLAMLGSMERFATSRLEKGEEAELDGEED